MKQPPKDHLTSTAPEYVQQDSLGGTVVVTNGTRGAAGVAMTYYPFSGARSSTGALGTDKKFTGQRLDGTGLYFYNARYYDPGLGSLLGTPDGQQFSGRAAAFS